MPRATAFTGRGSGHLSEVFIEARGVVEPDLIPHVEDLLSLRKPAHRIRDAEAVTIADRSQSVVALELPGQVGVGNAKLVGDIRDGDIGTLARGNEALCLSRER